MVAYARANVLHPLESELLLWPEELRYTSGRGSERERNHNSQLV